MKKGLIISILFFSLILINTTLAYELGCKIETTPYRFDDFVVAKSFSYQILLSNLENETFPGANVKVSVLDSDDKAILPNKTFSLPVLNESNNTYNYVPPWESDQSKFQLYDLDREGVWKIIAKIDSLDGQSVTVQKEGITRINSCEHQFDVISRADYETKSKEQPEQPTEKEDNTEIILAWSLFFALFAASIALSIAAKSFAVFLILFIGSIFIVSYLYSNHLLLRFWDILLAMWDSFT